MIALPLGREQRRERLLAELVADFRAEDRPQLLVELLLGAGADVHQQRIDDPVAREGIDLEPALVGREDLLALHVDVLDALVDPDDLVDERDAEGDARARGADRPAGLVLVEDPHRLAEADDDRLLGLGTIGKLPSSRNSSTKRDDRRHRSGGGERSRSLLPLLGCGCDFWTCGSGR